MSDKDGGPAFPIAAYTLSLDGKPMLMVKDGMTLHDWYVGMALQGMLASAPIADRSPGNVRHAGWAANAHKFADAIIAERERRRTK